jgi:hypothetical protein
MQGFTTKELKDSFNFPIYYPSAKEIHMAMENSNIFAIQKFEM